MCVHLCRDILCIRTSLSSASFSRKKQVGTQQGRGKDAILHSYPTWIRGAQTQAGVYLTQQVLCLFQRQLFRPVRRQCPFQRVCLPNNRNVPSAQAGMLQTRFVLRRIACGHQVRTKVAMEVHKLPHQVRPMGHFENRNQVQHSPTRITWRRCCLPSRGTKWSYELDGFQKSI